MPTYDYDCARCGGFEALRSVSRRDEPAACPGCDAPSPRVLAAAPRLACLEADTRRAMDLNERSRHQPLSSEGYARLKHPAGCGCCSATRRATTVRGANGAKAFPTRRPWMISH